MYSATSKRCCSFMTQEVLDQYPDTAELFFSIGMHCLGCPASRGETIEEACMVHGADADALVADLNKAIA